MEDPLYYLLPEFLSDNQLGVWASINTVARKRSQRELLQRLTEKIQSTVDDMIRRYSTIKKYDNMRDYMTCFCSSTEVKSFILEPTRIIISSYNRNGYIPFSRQIIEFNIELLTIEVGDLIRQGWIYDPGCQYDFKTYRMTYSGQTYNNYYSRDEEPELPLGRTVRNSLQH